MSDFVLAHRDTFRSDSGPQTRQSMECILVPDLNIEFRKGGSIIPIDKNKCLNRSSSDCYHTIEIAKDWLDQLLKSNKKEAQQLINESGLFSTY